MIIVQGGVQKNMRMYRCTVDGCYKCFARGEHLKRHVRSIHTNEKRECFPPFFSLSMMLTPIAAHKCPVEGCGKDFSRHDNLGQHMRVHKGQGLTHMLGDD
jgi:C2H2 transcription facotor